MAKKDIKIVYYMGSPITYTESKKSLAKLEKEIKESLKKHKKLRKVV